MPRPILPDGQKRTVMQSIRFRPDEWETIVKLAEKAGRMPHTFVRERTLGIVSKPNKARPGASNGQG